MPHSPSPCFPQLFYDLLYTRSPFYTQAFQVVRLPFISLTKTLYAFSQTSVHISRFAYLVVLDVVILVFCRGHKSCSSSPRKLFQSPVISSLLGPICSPATHSQTPSSYFQILLPTDTQENVFKGVLIFTLKLI